MANARAAKERKRLDQPAPEYPVELPELRRCVIVIDFDHGRVEHRIDLFRTNRVDCYRAVVNGKVWKERVGWTQVLNGFRKSFVRVGSFTT